MFLAGPVPGGTNSRVRAESEEEGEGRGRCELGTNSLTLLARRDPNSPMDGEEADGCMGDGGGGGGRSGGGTGRVGNLNFFVKKTTATKHPHSF